MIEDIREAIEKNLPSQVADVLKKRLSNIEFLEQKNKELYKKIDDLVSLKLEAEDLEELKKVLDKRQKDLDKWAEELHCKDIRQEVESLKGKVASAKVWAKERNFSYPLKSRGAEKKLHFKGCYWLIAFTVDTEKLPELKETIRLEERILRSMIINREGYIKSGLMEGAPRAA